MAISLGIYLIFRQTHAGDFPVYPVYPVNTDNTDTHTRARFMAGPRAIGTKAPVFHLRCWRQLGQVGPCGSEKAHNMPRWWKVDESCTCLNYIYIYIFAFISCRCICTQYACDRISFPFNVRDPRAFTWTSMIHDVTLHCPYISLHHCTPLHQPISSVKDDSKNNRCR